MRLAHLAERDGHFASPIRRVAHSVYRLPGCQLHGTSSAESMRLHATRESCDQGEITVLAIVETVLAVAMLITLTIWFDTAVWLAGACMLSPMLLLRTQESVQRGLCLKKWCYKGTRLGRTIAVIGFLVVLPLALWILGWWALLLVFPFTGVGMALAVYPLFFVIRCTATVSIVIQHPLRSFAAIPSNWRRVVAATDVFLDPEFVPGEPYGPLTAFRGWNYKNSIEHLLFLTTTLTLYPLCAAYRWSVKATCVVYLPLVWLVNKARYRNDSVQHMLSDYLADEIQIVRRLALVLTGGILIVKIIVLMRVDEIAAAVKASAPEWGLKILRALHPYLTPRHIELWQLTPVLNGLLAVGMWLYARRMLRLGDRAPAASTIQMWWNVMSCVTLVLSIYSIACLLKITWDHGDLPGTLHRIYEAIEWRFFPQTAKP